MTAPFNSDAIVRHLGDLLSERDALRGQVEQVRRLHQPHDTPDDQYASQRCTGCVADYDPKTGELVYCAYPCPTIRALEAEETAS